jgi:hypothetical protein
MVYRLSVDDGIGVVLAESFGVVVITGTKKM